MKFLLIFPFCAMFKRYLHAKLCAGAHKKSAQTEVCADAAYLMVSLVNGSGNWSHAAV